MTLLYKSTKSFLKQTNESVLDDFLGVINQDGTVDEEYVNNSEIINELLKYKDAVEPDEYKHIVFDLHSVKTSDNYESHIKQKFFNKLQKNPYEILNTIAEYYRRHDKYSDKAHVKIINTNIDDDAKSIIPERKPNTIRIDDEYKLVKIEGRIIDITQQKSNVVKALYECPQGHTNTTIQERYRNELNKPMKCSKEECNYSIPAKNYNDRMSKKINTQNIIIANKNSDSKNSTSIIGEIDEPYINKLDRRDLVNVYAVVMTTADDDNVKKDYYLHIVGIERLDDTIELEDEDIKQVKQIKEESDDILNTLQQSVAPNIINQIGQNIAKKAILCSIVKSTKKSNRNGIHVLLYGLPGSGKTQLLQHAHEISPISKQADASEASQSGLKASVVQETNFNNRKDGWVLYSGKIPNANNGTCVIDELDKASQSIQTSLNTPMESHVVLVDKVVNAELQANVSIIAGANPIDETYGVEPPISRINLPDSTKSRFDLIIRVDAELHSDKEKNVELEKQMLKNDINSQNLLTTKELQKYLTYARTIKPEMTEAAIDEIAEKIVEMKMQAQQINIEGVEITNRMQAKVKRISIAMAKLRLGQKVTVTDVRNAFEIIHESWQSLTEGAFNFQNEEIEILNTKSQKKYIDNTKKQIIETIHCLTDKDDTIHTDAIFENVDRDKEIVKTTLQLLDNDNQIELDLENKQLTNKNI